MTIWPRSLLQIMASVKGALDSLTLMNIKVIFIWGTFEGLSEKCLKLLVFLGMNKTHNLYTFYISY